MPATTKRGQRLDQYARGFDYGAEVASFGITQNTLSVATREARAYKGLSDGIRTYWLGFRRGARSV